MEIQNMSSGSNSSEQRTQAFMACLEPFEKGHYDDCLSLLEKVRLNHGEHISHDFQRASCYFHMGQMKKYVEFMKIAENKYNQFKSQLSEYSRNNCVLLLARHKEEMGLIQEALESYSLVTDQLATTENKSLKALYEMALANQLRVSSMWRDYDKISNHYMKLVMFQREVSTQFFSFESEHALMMTELEVIGAQSAKKRFSQLFFGELPMESDKNLIYYDYLEAVIYNGYPLDFELLEIAPSPSNLYENTIHRLAKFKLEQKFLPSWKDIKSESMLFADYLRLLTHYCQLLKGDEREEVLNHLVLLSQNLSLENRNLLQQRILFPRQKIVQISKENFLVKFNGQRVDFEKRAALFDILVLLENKPSWALDEFCQQLFQSEYDESYYQRLRMSCQRLSKMISPDKDKLFQLDTQNLSLVPEVKVISWPISKV